MTTKALGILLPFRDGKSPPMKDRRSSMTEITRRLLLVNVIISLELGKDAHKLMQPMLAR